MVTHGIRYVNSPEKRCQDWLSRCHTVPGWYNGQNRTNIFLSIVFLAWNGTKHLPNITGHRTYMPNVNRIENGPDSIVGTFVCLLFLYVLATSMVISGWVPTFDSAHAWCLYSAAPLRDQAASTMTWYPTQFTLSWHSANQSLPYHSNIIGLTTLPPGLMTVVYLPHLQVCVYLEGGGGGCSDG